MTTTYERPALVWLRTLPCQTTTTYAGCRLAGQRSKPDQRGPLVCRRHVRRRHGALFVSGLSLPGNAETQPGLRVQAHPDRPITTAPLSRFDRRQETAE